MSWLCVTDLTPFSHNIQTLLSNIPPPPPSKLENKEGTVYLKPWTRDAVVYVNGEQIVGETSLKHGDRVILGGSQYFRYIIRT